MNAPEGAHVGVQGRRTRLRMLRAQTSRRGENSVTPSPPPSSPAASRCFRVSSARNPCLRSESGWHDAQLPGGEGQCALIDDLAHPCDEVIAGRAEDAAEHDDTRIEQAGCERYRFAQDPPGRAEREGSLRSESSTPLSLSLAARCTGSQQEGSRSRVTRAPRASRGCMQLGIASTSTGPVARRGLRVGRLRRR